MNIVSGSSRELNADQQILFTSGSEEQRHTDPLNTDIFVLVNTKHYSVQIPGQIGHNCFNVG